MATVPYDGSISVDQVELEFAIKRAVEEACKNISYLPQRIYFGFSGFVRSFHVGTSVGVEFRVTKYDIQRAIDVAAGIDMPEDMAMLEQVYQFYLNSEEIIDNPHGMEAKSLDIISYNILASRTVLKNIAVAANKLPGLISYNVTSSELVAAEVLLSSEDKQNGVCLLDIGGEYTSLIIYHAGVLGYTASVPWGGNRLTEQIKFLIGRNTAKAEQAKIAFSQGGHSSNSAERDEVISKLMDKELLVLCSHLDTELSKSELEGDLKAGIILTGGTSTLPSLQDTIERELQIPVRRAQFPDQAWLEGLPLEYASSIGLVLRGLGLIRSWFEH
jgi:cell division protein FtsA